jgi:hypothetical protein
VAAFHEIQVPWKTMKSPLCPLNFHKLAVCLRRASIPGMSRRSRRARKAGGAGWLGKAGLVLVVLGVLGAAVLYGTIRGYLHSDAFRRFLSAKVSQAADVDGQFTPFTWDGLAVETSSFEATGKGMFHSVKLDGLHTEVGLGGLRRGVWEIQSSRVQRVEVQMDGRAGDGKPMISSERPPKPSSPAQKPWLPTEVEVQGAEIGELVVLANLDHGPVRVDGMRLKMEPGGAKNAYRIEAADGRIQPPPGLVPELRLERAKMRYQDGQVFLNSASASAWQNGRLETSGEWDSASGRYSFQGDVSGVKCEDLLDESWAKRFTGDVKSDFSAENLSGELVARGRLTILNGTLTALPVLDALAAYADTRRFRVLTLSEAHSDWRWKNGELFLSNLVLGSEGLVRLEGSLYLRGETLDGSFRLGLAPGTLASIPGAETDVFVAGERGLMWATLRISGTLADPKEDLTDRLVAAAGLRMFDVIPETGEKVIRFSRSLLGDTPSKTVDRGVKIIEKGVGLVDGVGGVIDGFFGSAREAKPAEPPKEDP